MNSQKVLVLTSHDTLGETGK